MNCSSPLVFYVPQGKINVRLDSFLRDSLEDISREKIKEEIKKGNILIDGKVCSSPKQLLKIGQEVTAIISLPEASLFPEEGEIDVLYKDPELIVINKSAGITVHPCPSCPEGTLANRLVAQFPELLKQDGVRPGIVHRLDKDTSGLMLVALSERARLALCDQFAEHAIYKEYLALIHGVLQKAEGEIEAPMGRDPKSKVRMAVIQGGKPARTSWKTLYADPTGRFSLLAVRIYTGRTHQIRVHMSYLGHALLGDSVYGTGQVTPLAVTKKKRETQTSSEVSAKKIAPRLKPNDVSSGIDIHRQMLHAWRLAFAHPFPTEIASDFFSKHSERTPSRASSVVSSFTKYGEYKGKSIAVARAEQQENRLSFVCRPPEDFLRAVRSLIRMPLKVVITGMPGCGKSTVIKALTRMDIPVFSADAEVAQLYTKEGDGTYLIRSRFGEEFVAEDGSLNKKKLGTAMRQSEQFRREVEALIHPLVSHATQAFFSRCIDEKSNLAVAEIPLFFETGGTEQKGKDLFVVGVHCPFSLRAERLAANRGWTEEVIAGMERWQWSEEKKMSACHAIIENTGSEEDLTLAVKALYKDLLQVKNQKEEEILAKIAYQIERGISPNDSLLL